MSVSRSCCIQGEPAPPPGVEYPTTWGDWNWDADLGQWVDQYGAGVGVLGRFSAETYPGQTGGNEVYRHSAGFIDMTTTGIVSGSTIHSATIKLINANPFSAQANNYIGIAEVRDDGDPPSTMEPAATIAAWPTVAGSTAYSLGPNYQDSTNVNITSLIQAVVNRGDFAGNWINFKLTTDNAQPINGTTSSSFGGLLTNKVSDPTDGSIVEISWS